MEDLSLWLDDYDDIYSDFDSRHYLKRRISEDFLYELKTALKYKKDHVSNLVLLLPQEKRNEENEKMIVENLNQFFYTQFQNQKNRYNQKVKNGILLLLFGIIVMSCAALFSINKINSFILILPKVILEPGGWFLLWLALDFLVFDLKNINRERLFFKELSEIKVHFKAA